MSTTTVASVSPAPSRCAASAPPSSSKTLGRRLFDLAEPGEDDSAQRQVCRRHDRQQLALFAAKARGLGERASNRTSGRFVEPTSGRRQNPLLPYSCDRSAGMGQVRLGKADFHRVTSGCRRGGATADRGMGRTWPIDIFERAGRRQRAASNNIGSPGGSAAWPARCLRSIARRPRGAARRLDRMAG